MFAKIAKRDYDGDSLIYLKTKSAKFTFDEPVPWTLDGEFGGEYELTKEGETYALKPISGQTSMFDVDEDEDEDEEDEDE